MDCKKREENEMTLLELKEEAVRVHCQGDPLREVNLNILQPILIDKEQQLTAKHKNSTSE